MYKKVSYDQIYDEHIYMFSLSSIEKISQEKYVICSIEDSKFIINNNDFFFCHPENKRTCNH